MSTTTHLNRAAILAIAEGAISCPADMAAELDRDPHRWIGGALWYFVHVGGIGTALRGPGGEGGIEHGAGTVWGTWADGPDGLVFTAEDARTDDGESVRYDALGVALPA